MIILMKLNLQINLNSYNLIIIIYFMIILIVINQQITLNSYILIIIIYFNFF